MTASESEPQARRSETPAPPVPAPLPEWSGRDIRPLAWIAAGAMFMENLDGTVIVTALPSMAVDFGVQPTQLVWGVTAYLLAAAVCVPVSGWLADRWGMRSVLCGAIALFTAASMLCGASTDLWTFIGARLLQGAAAALMTPVARLAVVRHAAKSQLMQAVAIMTWPALIAPLLGPPLGGLLTTHASWRWIFFINLPIGLLGIALVCRLVPNAVAADLASPRGRFDVPGFVLFAGALSMLVLGLELVIGNAVSGSASAVLLVLGFLLGALALRRARVHRHPVVGLAASRVQSFAVANLSGGLLSRLAISATPFLLPLFFQLGLGMSAAASGLLLLPYFAGNIGMKLFTTRIIRRFGFKRVLLVNGLGLGATVAAAAWAGPGWPVSWLAAMLVAGGCCRSLQMTALNSLSFADVAPADTASANTLASLVQQIATTLGVATASVLLNASLASRGGATLALQDFGAAFLGVAALAVAALLFYRRLPADAGAAVSGRQAGAGGRVRGGP